MEAKLWMGERAVLVRLMAKFLGANEADASVSSLGLKDFSLP